MERNTVRVYSTIFRTTRIKYAFLIASYVISNDSQKSKIETKHNSTT